MLPTLLLQWHGLSLSDSEKAGLARAFTRIGADEGTLWLLDEASAALVPVWNSGPHAGRFVGRHRQPLEAGLISLVCINGRALCENGVYRSAGQDPTLDRHLGLLTCAMIAVPFAFRDAVCGVVSCVKVKPASGAGADPPPFSAADLAGLVAEVDALARRLEAS